MTAATTTNGAMRIRYAVSGAGDPLVLLHGFTDGLESWEELGYAGPLLAAGRRLILIDARGHGGSSRPRDPAAYAPGERARDVAAVLDALSIARADLLGYSMGGWIALDFARLFPARVGRLAVGGVHPFGQSMAGYRRAVAADIRDWIGVLEGLGGGNLPEALRTRILANDLAALQAAVAEDRPDISAELAAFDRPCLFWAGAEDPLRDEVARCAAFLPRASFAEIPGCNHLTALTEAELVLPHLLPFLGSARWS
ncbi:alpha/beta fold hydrolase [Falsiroseomonas sp.]|uniref:alpha/beta fold hydrolase n=1 Tax=Falsiroseomonas sp. TaxID=2870721 RepID=UPI0035636089